MYVFTFMSTFNLRPIKLSHGSAPLVGVVIFAPLSTYDVFEKVGSIAASVGFQ